MTYFVDTGGENPHVNYEPSTMGGLAEADQPGHGEQGPVIEGRLTRARIPRTNDYQQPGERFRLMGGLGARRPGAQLRREHRAGHP